MVAATHYHLFDTWGPSCVHGCNTTQPPSWSATPTASIAVGLKVQMSKTQRRDGEANANSQMTEANESLSEASSANVNSHTDEEGAVREDEK